MDFQDTDDQILPEVDVNQIINELSENDNCTTEEGPSKLSHADETTDQITNSGDGALAPKLEPFATTSKSKNVSVTSETKNKGIQEFVRILRPHLPRKSKSKAYKMLQNIAKGIIVESSFRRKIQQKTKRPQRKARFRNTKTKSLGGVRRNARSTYSSSDSSPSDASCPRCGYSCCKVSRY